MKDKSDSILSKLYNQRLNLERATRSLATNVVLPKGQEEIIILPVSNIFYGNENAVPRLEILLDQIKRVNSIENGAFVLGGNLFYYPPGVTEEKQDKAKRYINDLCELFKDIDKNKILLMYNGVNENKFLDDRTLKYPIPTTQTLAGYLGVPNRYFATNLAELNFVFNNSTTDYKNQTITSLFSSVRPISATKSAIIKKVMNIPIGAEKDFVLDTSSSQHAEVTRMATDSSNGKPTHFANKLISFAGYTFAPQIVTLKTGYTINTRALCLSFSPCLTNYKNQNNYNEELKKLRKNIECRTIGASDTNTIKINDTKSLLDSLAAQVASKKIADEFAKTSQYTYTTKEPHTFEVPYIEQYINSKEIKNNKRPENEEDSYGYSFER